MIRLNHSLGSETRREKRSNFGIGGVMGVKSSCFLKATTIVIALLGGAAVVSTVAAPDFAFAKEGKGNGNGGGKGNGNSGGNGNGNSGGNGKGNSGDNGNASREAKGNGAGKGIGAGNSKSKSVAGSRGDLQKGKKTLAGKSNLGRSKSTRNRDNVLERVELSLREVFGGKKARQKTTKPQSHSTGSTKVRRTVEKRTLVTTSTRPEARTIKHEMAYVLGAHPSELGALNAAHASENALRNAAPNSRVGRIATYRDTVIEGDELRDELADREDFLAGLQEPERPISEIEDDLKDAVTDVRENRDRVQELEEAFETDPSLEDELNQAKEELADSVEVARDLRDERRAAVEYEETVQEVEDLAEQVEDQEVLEREALEEAANKPVTDEVEAAVKELLGI